MFPYYVSHKAVSYRDKLDFFFYIFLTTHFQDTMGEMNSYIVNSKSQDLSLLEYHVTCI